MFENHFKKLFFTKSLNFIADFEKYEKNNFAKSDFKN